MVSPSAGSLKIKGEINRGIGGGSGLGIMGLVGKGRGNGEMKD
jgi:hypothetical protein